MITVYYYIRIGDACVSVSLAFDSNSSRIVFVNFKNYVSNTLILCIFYTAAI